MFALWCNHTMRLMILGTRKNLLIFPAGTENGLEIWKSLKDCKEVRLFGATNESINHTEYVFENPLVVPSVHESNWVERLNELLLQNQIDLIYPANSIVIDALIENRNKINCEIILPSTDIVKLTRSKTLTIQVLKNSIPVPKLYEDNEEISEFPIFAKPDKGYGSQNAILLNNKMEYTNFINTVERNLYVFQEYLPGNEYSIDCLSDDEGVIFCEGRSRQRIRMGTSMHSEIADENLQYFFKNIASEIHNKIKITGAWFFQMKADSLGSLKLLEIDIRIAGTMALNRVRGINFPLLTLYIFKGKKITTMVNPQNIVIDRCLQNRYKSNLNYDKVFIDLDDTIIGPNGLLNTDVIKFLYQCINKKIKIVLISKNLKTDKVEYLKSHKILNIFDEIFWLREDEKKSDYMVVKEYSSAIFIDDSFSQRREVFERLNIPTFDLSMLEMLIDDRY